MQTFQPSTIFYTPDALNERGQKALLSHPAANHQAIQQHNRLPALESNHFQVKSEVLVLGRLKTLVCKESGRSSDFISPSLANGCMGACAYCYVDRNKPVNPITLFTNTEEILAAVDKHVRKQVWPKVPNQTHSLYYTYDIGCNSDISVDAAISDNVKVAVDFYRHHPKAFATFATKFVNPELLTYDPQQKVRIRFSLLPHKVSKLVDVRTDSIEKRIYAINDFYQAGYEVHVNFSPVIVYEGWQEDYRELFEQLNHTVHPKVKEQMSSEVIFLTHNFWQHQANLAINPKAEALIWTPETQETKRSQFGGINVRYQHQLKAQLIAEFKQLQQEIIPWCAIRYIF
ncbi:spore photoproduct lyase family protein [Adhaeribacter radiodurans]|uniref:Spore photoproduct lyase family protein n=1 Tax=Adhaeribacter radiodurans TaxID=2745197 RepID=A0A7L7L9Z7_9BACT|nr:spore photoproduct lyase family protein [Adhaeribacter radiodurans]QMU29573.1 spore photoproduct lyase family protein [Adhaeribacter radiodurans]